MSSPWDVGVRPLTLFILCRTTAEATAQLDAEVAMRGLPTSAYGYAPRYGSGAAAAGTTADWAYHGYGYYP